MRYRSLVGATAMLLGVAACKAKDPGMNADLAKDLDAAKTSDALALAPHAGVQSVVSATELSPQARVRVQASTKTSRLVAHHTPHRDRVTPAASEASDASDAAPAPVDVATSNVPAPVSTPVDPAATSAPVPSPRPQPVDVSYPGTARGSGDGGGSSIGGIIGAIGGAILRGGVVDGDHCDPRGRRRGGGDILINRRGPIFRSNF